MPFDKEALTKKWHGVPVYGWIVGGGLVLGLGYRYYKNHAGATPAATAGSEDTPSAADSSPTSFDTGLPWAGGAPGSASDFSDLSAQQLQNSQDISGVNAALDAAQQQEASDWAQAQSDLLAQQAQQRSIADSLAAQLKSAQDATNASILALSSVKPTPALAPSQANIPAQQATPGIGPSQSSYLPPSTIANASKNAKKNNNSGVHAN